MGTQKARLQIWRNWLWENRAIVCLLPCSYLCNLAGSCPASCKKNPLSLHYPSSRTKKKSIVFRAIFSSWFFLFVSCKFKLSCLNLPLHLGQQLKACESMRILSSVCFAETALQTTDYFKLNGHLKKSYHYKAEAWLLSSVCFMAANFLHFGKCVVYSFSWNDSKSKAWNRCERCLVLRNLLSLIDGLHCHFVKCSGEKSSSFRSRDWFFKNTDAQKWFSLLLTEQHWKAGLSVGQRNPQFCNLFDIFLSSQEHLWK